MKNRLHLVALTTIAMLATPVIGCGGEENHEDNHANHEDNHANHEDNHANHEDNHANHEDNHANHEEGEEHACIHFESGPNVEITAADDAMAELSETFEEHTRIDVTLPADTSFVQWTPDDAGEIVFWLSDDVPFTLLDGETELMPEESGGAATGCEDLAVVHHKFDVEAKSYVIQISPAAAGDVLSFVAAPAEHSH